MKLSEWPKIVLHLAGVVWIARAAIQAAFDPIYWRPTTLIDYAAVAGTTLSLYLLVAGLIGFHLRRRLVPSLSKWLWLAGLTVTCAAAVMIGTSNLIEDWFGVQWFGDVFVWSTLALLVGMLLLVGGSFRAPYASRWQAWLILAGLIAIPLQEIGGGAVMGMALIGLGWLVPKSEYSVSHGTPNPPHNTA